MKKILLILAIAVLALGLFRRNVCGQLGQALPTVPPCPECPDGCC